MCVDETVSWIDISIGQSNCLGAAASIGGTWPENEDVLIWNGNFDEGGAIGDGALPLDAARRGVSPFNISGANNFGVHAADYLQRALGGRSVYLLHAVGGEGIDSFLPGGRVWNSLVANMAVLRALFPNAVLRSVTMHHGESAQLETNEWYLGKLQLLFQTLRAQPWFPAGTPIVLGQIYAGVWSSSRHFYQNYALTNVPFLDACVGLVSSQGVVTVDEGHIDSFGAPYRIHFTGDSHVVMGLRYGAAVLGLLDGSHIPASFSLKDRLGATKDNPDVINVSTGGALALSRDQLLNSPIIKCVGAATIILPDISSTSISSVFRQIAWEFSIFRNGSSGVVTVSVGANTDHRIVLDGGSPAAAVAINDTEYRTLTYSRDGRWH